MSLVSYDHSSGSESEDEADTGTVHFPSATINNTANGTSNTAHFLHLPQPKAKTHITLPEEDDEFLKIKEKSVEKPVKRKLIKFNVPSPSQFDSDEEDEPVTKKIQHSNQSSLFSMLPPPKQTPLSNISFVPNILKKKVPVKPKLSSLATKKPVEAQPVSKTVSDSEDEDVPETFDDEMWQKVCGRQLKPRPKVPQSSVQTQEIELAPAAEKPYQGLDNEAFKELVGSNKKNRGNIEVIDIHEDEIRPDKEHWLKSLTDPNFEPEPSFENPVNSTQKVKNHITALAQKALANDKELQIRWSENRHSRKQTQAKYGF